MKAKPILSVIIANYNTRDFLKDALKFIFKSEKKHSFFEVIVIDNNSKDGSCKMVRQKFPRVKLISSRRNLGFAKANNLAAKKAAGKYLLFLNSDTLVNNGALDKMVKFLEKHLRVGVLGPKLVLKSGKIQPFPAGYKLNLVQALKIKLAAFLSGIGVSSSFLAKLSLEYWDWSRPKKVDWVTGAALMIRKEIFEQLAGFDTKFFMYFEDQDLCLRTEKIGGEVWVLPSASIVHLGGKSIKLDARRKKYYYQSQDLFFKKHFGKMNFWLMKIISLPYRLSVIHLKK